MARTKRARKIRTAQEFNVQRLMAELRPPYDSRNEGTWTIEQIRAARDDQMRGAFQRPVLLADAMRTDPALFAAYNNRLAPAQELDVEMVPANGTRGEAVASEGEALFGAQGVAVTDATIGDIIGTRANHGIAIGYNVAVPREDGSRIDIEHRHWPLEWVRWDPLARCLMTQVDTREPGAAEAERAAHPELDVRAGYFEVPIVHGDGRWVVYQKHSLYPWKQDACVLPGGMVWARHAYAERDWSAGSKSHGNSKVVGTMPKGYALADEGGTLTAEAASFLTLIQGIASGELPAGIKMEGALLEVLTNTSTAWQVWAELTKHAEKAAARIYLGTDGMLGAAGGAPGVDITQLFGVATTIVQGDLACFEWSFLTGAIEPWAAWNFGDSSLAPRRRYMMPDADAAGVREERSKRVMAFFDHVEKIKATGFVLDEKTVTDTANLYDVPAPTLPPATEKAPSITLAPTDIARVVTVNEARASAGLGALMLPTGGADPDGLLTIEQYGEKKKAQPAATVAPAGHGAAVPPAPAPLRLVPQPAEPAEPTDIEIEEHASKMNAALLADIREARALGLTFTQQQIDENARRYGVAAPKLEKTQ